MIVCRTFRVIHNIDANRSSDKLSFIFIALIFNDHKIIFSTKEIFSTLPNNLSFIANFNYSPLLQ